MSEKRIENKTYSAELIEKNVLLVKVKKFEELSVDDYIEIQRWVQSYRKNSKIISLLEFGVGSSSTREAREYGSSPEGNTLSKGAAIVVKNIGQRLLADYYLKYNKPALPTKIFSKREKALSWIEKEFN